MPSPPARAPGSVSYARGPDDELWRDVGMAARGLLARGVRRGDRVGLWAPNCAEWVIVQLAAARMGAILVTLNPAYKAAELEHALVTAGVRTLVMAREFRGSSYEVILGEVRGRCPDLRDSIVLDDDWADLLDAGSTVPAGDLARIESTLQSEDPINVQFTSGTTGRPKGATLSHRTILNNGYLTGRSLGYAPADRVCVPVPFYHCFGMVLGTLACVSAGACIVAPGAAFDAGATLEAVAAERCTSLYGVPTMFIAELEHAGIRERDLSSLRTGIMGGAPCPAEVMKQVRERMHVDQITVACGMTETGPLSTMTAVDDPLEKRVGTVGRAHMHVEVKIVDPATGATVPRGTPGEQCTRGYNVMLGYYGDEPATRRAVDADGWMHSGDVAVMDDEGYVQIVGRIKDMIIRGGENISPREVEELLAGVPGVSDAYVVGVPSERYGEEVMAWVKPRAGVTLRAEELVAHCRERIAAYKVPRYWEFVDSFPMTVTGKVQKFRLRELAAALDLP